MLKSIIDNKNFQTWLLVGWRLCQRTEVMLERSR